MNCKIWYPSNIKLYGPSLGMDMPIFLAFILTRSSYQSGPCISTIITCSSVWRYETMIVSFLIQLPAFLNVSLLEINIDGYHICRSKGFFVLFLLDHLEPSTNMFSSRVTGIYGCCKCRFSSFMTLAFILSLVLFLNVVKALISFCTFRISRVSLCLATLAMAHFLLFGHHWFQTSFIEIVGSSPTGPSRSFSSSGRSFIVTWFTGALIESRGKDMILSSTKSYIFPLNMKQPSMEWMISCWYGL